MCSQNIEFLIKIAIILGIGIISFIILCRYSLNGYEEMLKSNKKKGGIKE